MIFAVEEMVVEMEAEVAVVILVMVEEMVEGEVGHFLLLLPAGQTKVVVVAMVPNNVIGLAVAMMDMRELEVAVPRDRVPGLIVLVTGVVTTAVVINLNLTGLVPQAMMERSHSHRPGASSFHSEKTRESSRSP
ncbi:hypothetical protein NL676_015049 [Syzygium grande]|nr:hypothetical protein NL676_015049 [Syzygium grande]